MSAHSLPSLPKKKAEFVEPMECLPVSKLPEGPQWVYEIKLDGYRAVAVKTGGKVTLFSRNHKSFSKRFPLIVEGLVDLPDETVIDGEIVALDVEGRPDFNLLQNFREAASQIVYYAFDILVYQNRDLTRLPLRERRELLFSALKLRSNRIFASEFFEVSAQIMLQSAKEQGLEGIIGKRSDSLYELGKRSGYWVKYRLNLGQEFVIGGFTAGPHGIDAIIVGYYRGQELIYVARTRNGFVPASRRRILEKLKPLVTPSCPFTNLPEARKARWGEALNAEKMKKCLWVRPEVVAQLEFLEWTDTDHLRHSKFVGLREDKDARTVEKEKAEPYG
jgi:DNA ligase D-like protein (predicted ligase)